MSAPGNQPVRRPRNRKARLAESAAELFRKHGYHQVGVNDIARSAGVTGPAVYRHFRGKQDILAHVLLSGMDTFGLVTEEALATPGTPSTQLDTLLRAVAALAVDRREVTALWRWEGRHLARADQAKIRHRGTELIAQWGIALRDVRTDLRPADAELLCWAALSVYGSVAVHHVTPPRRRFEELLAALAAAVLYWPIQPADTSQPADTNQPTDTNQPAAASQATAASQPTATSQPAATNHPTDTSQPIAASQLADASQPAATNQSADTSQSAAANQSADARQSAVSSQPTATSQSADASQPTAASQPAVSQAAISHPSAQPAITQPVSRREELLTAATRLFRDRGYAAVSMEDIGSRAGMAGPSIYRYFPGKAAILVAAGHRMADWLASSAQRATDDSAGPQDALRRLASSYVDTVLRSDNLMATFASELDNLPEPDRKELVRLQRAYVAQWVRLLRTVAPGLPEPDAKVVVHAALTIVNDLARTPRILARPGIAGELAQLAMTVLDARR